MRTSGLEGADPTPSQAAAEAARLFSAYRLQVAREAKGLSKSSLSKLVGVSAPALSQFESGQAKPKAVTLQKIADTLEFPPEFFSTNKLVVDPTQADETRMDYYGHFRSQRSMSVTKRRQSLTVAHLLRDVAGVLERHVQLPETTLPDLATYAPEDAARAIRQQFAMPPGPVANVIQILERQGVVCARFPLEADNISAFSVPSRERTFLVLHAPAKPKRDRDRFSASHELGHLLMHELATALATKEVEAAADKFASEFLMPAADIRDELPSRIDWPRFVTLKRRWGTSIGSLLRRARDLEVMTPRTYLQGVKTISARGWRHDEPGDLGPAETPQLLDAAVRLSQLSAIDIANECGWPQEKVNALFQATKDARPSLQF